MATVTQLDILNAVQYLSNRDSLAYILKWRNKFPHILIDYNIRWATDNDFYVPPSLKFKSAVIVQIAFSKEGCESMSCFPYTETGVIDYLKSPLGGYTQTSNTPVQYNQPACFNLDPAAATRDGKIQSAELRYTKNKQCVMVDSFTKAWMNAPYIRTSKHVVRGVDDVPGFDVYNDDDPVFPERIRGRFNQAYCRRFGRNERSNGCSLPWYETIISFVLGESILSTFKLIATGVVSDLRNYDYSHPSPILPRAPEPGGVDMLTKWYSVRDKTHDIDKEKNFLKNIFDMKNNEEIEYIANKGFRVGNDILKNSTRRREMMEEMLARRTQVLIKFNKEKKFINVVNKNTGVDKNNDNTGGYSLEDIIIRFLEDHGLILGILTDLGFSVLESTLTNMLKQLNKVLIPALKRMLLMQSTRVTVRLLGETYKAAMMHVLNRVFISTITTVAKATVRLISAAASIVNFLLIFLTLADFVLMIWDPLGYSSMFPRGYLDDLSNAFLTSYYESIGSSREIIEFFPIHFSNLINNDEEEYLADSMLHLADYLGALEVNSNGQMINLLDGDEIKDIDEKDLVGAGLAANDTWAYFKWFCTRHDAIVTKPSLWNNIIVNIGIMTCIGGLVYYAMYNKRLKFIKRIHLEILFLLIIVICCILVITPSLQYFTKLINHKIILKQNDTTDNK
nr:p74 [Pieris rapae granulovirus]